MPILQYKAFKQMLTVCKIIEGWAFTFKTLKFSRLYTNEYLILKHHDT